MMKLIVGFGRWLQLVAIVAASTASFADTTRAESSQPSSFMSFYDLPETCLSVSAPAISADGSVVVGQCSGPFRWTATGGLVSLGDLPGGTTGGAATAVSADGTVIVGWSDSVLGREAFRWTQATGMVGLGELPGGFSRSIANAVSADGLVVVGESSSASGREAFRWTSATGMVGLGDLAGGDFESEAFAVSADGSVIAGSSDSTSRYEAFRWTDAGGMIGLGFLTGGSFSNIRAMTSDGLTLVGSASDSVAFYHAVHWTSETGFTALPNSSCGPPFFCSTSARSITSTGSVTGGLRYDHSLYSGRAVIWDDTNGRQDLAQLLEELGVDLNDWVLEGVAGISADGSTMVGTGFKLVDEMIVESIWVAVLGDSIVEVPSLGSSGIAILLVVLSSIPCALLRQRSRTKG